MIFDFDSSVAQPFLTFGVFLANATLRPISNLFKSGPKLPVETFCSDRGLFEKTLI